MSHDKKKLPACTNCGYEFNGADNFCPECGQENHDIKIPLKHHIHELIEGLLHLDSKSFRTFLNLIVNPGLLSKEFNSGKRVKYVPPVRLYIFISFLFFLLLTTGKIIRKEAKSGKEEGVRITFLSTTLEEITTEEERAKLTGSQLDSLKDYRSGASSKELAGLNNSQIDSVLIKKNVGTSWLNRAVFRQLAKAGNEGEHIWKLIQKNVSYGMFLLMPFIGMFFYLFYRKQSGFYIENLVVAVHYQCVIFLIFSAVLFVDKFISFGIGYLIAAIMIPVYLFFMLKKYYGQKTFITLVKTVSIGLIQLLSTLFFYLLMTFITIVLL